MTTDSSDYNSLVLELFERRPHAGRMETASDVFVGRAGEQARGVEVQFWLKCAGGRIQATSFLAYGCPHSIAAASWWAQRVRGLKVSDAEQVGWREAEEVLSVPPEKRGRLLTVEDGMRTALNAATARG
jgi:NifU-like protein involved in Fe-S cluster formation